MSASQSDSMTNMEHDPNMYEVPGSRLRELRQAEEALEIATGGDSRIIRLVKQRDDAREQLEGAVEALRKIATSPPTTPGRPRDRAHARMVEIAQEALDRLGGAVAVWDHLKPDDVTRRTKNYGLAGGWLTPPTSTSVMMCPLCGGTGWLA